MDAPFEYDGGDVFDEFDDFAQELGRGSVAPTSSRGGRGGKRRVVGSLTSSASASAFTSTSTSTSASSSAPSSSPSPNTNIRSSSLNEDRTTAVPKTVESFLTETHMDVETGSGSGMSKYQTSMKLPPVPFSQRVYLSVPFDEKDDAKKRGAKWDPAKKKWWISNDKATSDVIEKWGGGSLQ